MRRRDGETEPPTQTAPMVALTRQPATPTPRPRPPSARS